MNIEPSEEDRKNAEIRLVTGERFCDIDKLVFSRNETFWMMVNKQAKLIACERIIGEMEKRIEELEISNRGLIGTLDFKNKRIAELEEQLKGKSK